ncbi:YraN family protein [Candidatus Peregrinibacteria bacterium]|nr:YraN family protein [Candidatus Peregrinibacteria bacterium]
MKPKDIGQKGEDLSAKYLIALNYEIITTNYHSRFGEIDLIALDKSVAQFEIVFVEVKTRTDLNYGSPQEAVTFQKRQRLIKTALHFLNQSSPKIARSWRIDLIAIILDGKGHLKKLQHFKNILNG